MTLTGILTIVLQVFGVLWAIGGAYVINEMRLALFVDRAIEKIELTLGEADTDTTDKGRCYWMLSGGILTLISGAGLMAASPYVVLPLAGLVVHQGFYAWRQHRLSRKALNEGDAEGADQAAMSPKARNGALTSVVVLMIAIVVFGEFWRAL